MAVFFVGVSVSNIINPLVTLTWARKILKTPSWTVRGIPVPPNCRPNRATTSESSTIPIHQDNTTSAGLSWVLRKLDRAGIPFLFAEWGLGETLSRFLRIIQLLDYPALMCIQEQLPRKYPHNATRHPETYNPPLQPPRSLKFGKAIPSNFH